jgi:hypothetical protein
MIVVAWGVGILIIYGLYRVARLLTQGEDGPSQGGWR